MTVSRDWKLRKIDLGEEIIGYKKAFVKDRNGKFYDFGIVKLRVPAGTKIVMPNRRRHGFCGSSDGKARAERAYVVDITSIDYSKRFDEVRSIYMTYSNGVGTRKKYRVGKFVFVRCFDDDPTATCSAGIHFFLTRKEAERY